MQEIINKCEPSSNLYGLVVCGGKSRRMATDKSLLVYFNKPYRYELYDLLTTVCEKVFISCNADQASKINSSCSFIEDFPKFDNIGPLAALLSAFDQFTGKDLLVIGCDYPFLTSVDIKDFIDSTNRSSMASAFYNPDSTFYEPLLAYYSHSAADHLFKMYSIKEFSLQHFLKNINAGKFIPENLKSMQNVNSIEEYQNALKEIQKMS